MLIPIQFDKMDRTVFTLRLKMIIFILFNLCFCSIYASETESSHFCDQVNEELPRSKLGTKTGYFYSSKTDNFWEELKTQSHGCTPVKVWFLTRHGTRYPTGKDYEKFEALPRVSEEILYNHLQGRGCLNEEDVFEFKRWIPPYEIRDKGQLHSTGYDELFAMGEHWKILFPTIFEDIYNSSKIKVEFTVRNRTGQSAYHFLRGMYGDDAIGTIELPKPYSPNYLLRFYKSCPLWLKEVYRNEATTYAEMKLFENSTLFQSVMYAVSSRLGYMHPMGLKELSAMYDECRYETAWFPHRKSIWCHPFSRKDIKILEYHQDLKYYYEDSYGTPMNKDMACKTVGDLYLRLRSAVSSPNDLPNGILYFSHDKALMKFQAALGLFKPREHLKHNNYDENRVFRTSKVAPFASNLAFVLYRCGMEHRVALFFQGSPHPMEHICSSIMCGWDQFQNFLKPIYQSCDLTRTCMMHDEL